MLELLQKAVCPCFALCFLQTFLICPTDLIISASIGKTDQEHENYADRFFALCDRVKRYNDDIHQHNSLFYMIETIPKDHVDLQKHSYCTCDSRGDYDCKRTLICNWPLETAIPTLRGLESSQRKENVAELETTLGFPNQYATSSGMFEYFGLTISRDLNHHFLTPD